MSQQIDCIRNQKVFFTYHRENTLPRKPSIQQFCIDDTNNDHLGMNYIPKLQAGPSDLEKFFRQVTSGLRNRWFYLSLFVALQFNIVIQQEKQIADDIKRIYDSCCNDAYFSVFKQLGQNYSIMLYSSQLFSSKLSFKL